MTQYHFIQSLLQVKDPNIIFNPGHEETTKNNKQIVEISGSLDCFPDHCSKCGHICRDSKDIIRNGNLTSDILLGSFNRKPIYLELKKQRYRCKHCGGTTTAETPLVDKGCFISKEVKRLILTDLSETKSMSLIAKEVSVSTHTVIRVLKTYGKQQFKSASHLPEHLSIDEFKSVKNVKGEMSCLLLDNETHQIVDILPDRTQSHLLEYFMQFSNEERSRVQTVTIDMFIPYYKFLQILFPHADIIIDRFHIVQLLTRELNKLRVTVMNSFKSTNRPLYNKYKRYWKLLLKNPTDLKWKAYTKFSLFKWLTNTQGIVDYLCDQNQELNSSYHCVQRLISLLRQKNKKHFFEFLQVAKKEKLPQNIKRALRTLEKFQTGIENSFIYTFSNGPIEGTNNKIKNIKRSGYGYRNFTHLKYRIQLSTAFRDKQACLPDPPYQWMVDAANKYNVA